MSSGVMLIMVMAVGLCMCSFLGSGAVVVMTNEKIINHDFFDFLLIPGWGKDAEDETSKEEKTTGTSDHCIDEVIKACNSGQPNNSLFNVDTHDACVATEKQKCLDDGGAWSSSFGSYPSDCLAGSRVECVGKRKQERETCLTN